MWFNPGELSKTKTSTLANLANLLISEPENTKTAHPISKLAGLAEPLYSEIIVDGLVSVADKQKILAWLSHIEEGDEETITETLDRCESDPEALAYFLRRADEALDQQPEPKPITCRGCHSFKSYNEHGGGAGHCVEGVQSLGVCFWADTAHQCDKYQLI